MHGWCHQAGPGGSAWRRTTAQLMARGAAEFATLGQAEADERLRAGLAELSALGIEPEGFHPPGWLASPGAVEAMRRLGMRYTCSQLAVNDLITERRFRIPALSQRPGSAGERLAARLVRGTAWSMTRAGRSFRIALHPDDLDRPGLRGVTLDVIDRALAAGMQASTYSNLVTTSSTVVAAR
jgi:predicted deacetylase